MYQIAPSYDSTKSLQWVQKAYQLFLPDYVCLTFMLMLGFYILLRVFGIPVWLAGLGGIMWAFSSYFFILISAGHIWKFITLAYVPPTIAGIVLAYRGKLLWGASSPPCSWPCKSPRTTCRCPITSSSSSFSLWEPTSRKHGVPSIAPVLQGKCRTDCGSPVGIAANVSNLYHTYAYSKETMRGKNANWCRPATLPSRPVAGWTRDLHHPVTLRASTKH